MNCFVEDTLLSSFVMCPTWNVASSVIITPSESAAAVNTHNAFATIFAAAVMMLLNSMMW